MHLLEDKKIGRYEGRLVSLSDTLPPSRHCEERMRRGNPETKSNEILRSAQNDAMVPSPGGRVREGGQCAFTLAEVFLSYFAGCRRVAFTLAEVLITLGIIGIVAAMTMPTLIAKYQDKQFKTAYKKVYSDISQAAHEAIFNQEYERSRALEVKATNIEMDIFKKKFMITKDCSGNSDIFQCWAKGDTLCGGSCSSGNAEDGIDMENGIPEKNTYNDCFVDASGRSWCNFGIDQNLYLVDINGFSEPNRFGKDRWCFTFGNEDGIRVVESTNYKKIVPCYNDVTRVHSSCKHPPCYYHSWLYK